MQDAARLQSQQQWATDPLFDYTTLLLQADNAPNAAQNNTFLDSSANAFTITRAGNTTQGTFTPFSATGWSNFFNGTTDFLTTSTNGWSQLGTGDFTVEAFCYIASYGSYFPIFDARSTSGNIPWILGVNSSGYADFFYGNSAGQRLTDTTATGLNAWIHIAAVRSGSTITLYVNGASRATVTYSSAVNGGSSTPSIGRLLDPLYANGYISNARVVVGTAVYTANFNPPTSPLTAITNTQLLTCQSNRFVDNSTSAYTFTVTGTPSVQAFAPFAPQFQYTPTVIGGSGYFDGSGDRVFANTATALNISGDFTMECWFYQISELNAYPWIFGTSGGDIGTETCFFKNYPNANAINFYNSGLSLNGGTVTSNQWYHVAATRSGSTTRMFVNGELKASSSTAFTFTTGQPWLVGDRPAGASGANYPFNGYVCGARVINGTALYTAAFTPPTSPPTAVTNTALLLNFTNAAITDGTMKNNLETVGNAQVSTSIVKYGAGSMAFDGTGDYLTSNAATTNLYAFGTGDFTIEMWVYFNGVASIQCVYDSRPTSTQGAYVLIYLNSDGTLRYFVSSADRITSSALSASTWYHVAVSRINGSTRLFINGTQAGSTYTDSTSYLNASGRPWVGINAFTTNTQGLNGYIDDLRITKGIARYTANFTPPQVALPRQ